MDTEESICTIEQFLIKHNLTPLTKHNYESIRDVLDKKKFGIAIDYTGGSLDWKLSDLAITLLAKLMKLVPIDYPPYKYYEVKKYKPSKIKCEQSYNESFKSTMLIPDIPEEVKEDYNIYNTYEELEEGYDCLDRKNEYLIITIIAMKQNINYEYGIKCKEKSSDITYELFDIKDKKYYYIDCDSDGQYETIEYDTSLYNADNYKIENDKLKQENIELRKEIEQLKQQLATKN